MSGKRFKLIAASAAAFAAMSAPAYAYIDPGMGSLLLQGVIGAVAAGLFTAKLWWARLVSIFAGAHKKTSAEPPKPETPAA